MLDTSLLLALKKKGWSTQRLAIHFEVSPATIKRRLKKKEKRDEKVMSFATLLEKFAREAPDGYCRKEIFRAVNLIRTRHSLTKDQKKRRICESIESGARTIHDIADDFGFQTQKEKAMFGEELIPLLDELVAEQRILKRMQGGKNNSGRKVGYHYLPLETGF